MPAGEENLAAIARRRPDDRLGPADRQRVWPFVERAAAARVVALAALGRDAAALAAVAAWRAVEHDEDALDAVVDHAERAVLGRRATAGAATPAERARLQALLLAWSAAGPDLHGREALALAEALADGGAAEAAAPWFERVLAEAGPGAGEAAELRGRAALGLCRAARARGDLVEAARRLAQVPAALAARFEVALERCRLDLARGRGPEALEGYTRLLRALEAGRPPAWWTVVEDLARAYAQVGDAAAARRLLEQVRTLAPDLGGDAARRERLLALMRSLDATR